MFAKDDLIATMRCEPGALLPCKLDWPLRKICYWGGQPADSRPANGETWSDEWGVTWRKESPDPMLMPFPIGHPLGEELDGVERFDRPAVDHQSRFADLAHLRCPANEMLVGEHPFSIYERAWLVTGMQNLLTAMASCPDRVDRLFEIIGSFEDEIARSYVDLKVEAAWISDDYGMNAALMFSPAMWRRFVRPHLKCVIDRYRRAGILVILHSCGNITPLIDDFLDLEIDVLDPLQPMCNNLMEIRRRTSGRLCLCGGVSSTTLMSGDTFRTARDTLELIQRLGEAGGYIVGPDDDQTYPDETHEAMLRTVQTYRDRRAPC
jgi:uroporphyrinogen decarboxylase